MSKDSAPATDQRKLIHPLWHVICLIPTAIFFVFLQRVAYNHTPDWSNRYKQIAAAYTALCLTGVFWMCLQGFYVTLVDQLRRKKAKIPS
jgi:ABC-type glycerol-3-phosphate transport system permease component